jgi:hypothetical protein
MSTRVLLASVGTPATKPTRWFLIASCRDPSRLEQIEAKPELLHEQCNVQQCGTNGPDRPQPYLFVLPDTKAMGTSWSTTRSPLLITDQLD